MPQSSAPIPSRTLGSTGEQVSLLGLGGFHLGIPSETEAIRVVRHAVDQGITFLDNSWDYNEGLSEIRMGKALRDGYRQRVFLMSKVDGRTRESATRQLEESLRRLQTDHLDLLQFHEVIRMSDPERIFAAGGALEAALAARDAGKVRFIGFTGHKSPAIHLRMLEMARTHRFRFDTVQMPLNVMDAHFESFERQVLPPLIDQGVGILGMKSMGDPFILHSGVVTATECLHYAMSLPVSVVITGCESRERVNQAVQAARTFEGLNSETRAELLARTARAARQGRYELYKSTETFDSTTRNRHWLG